MSLLSLLFALAVERNMPTNKWQFSFYFEKYLRLLKQAKVITSIETNLIAFALLILPVVAVGFVNSIFDNTVLNLVLSCAILLICIGCQDTRAAYKQYLQSAFKGEPTSCDLHYRQLLQDKNLPEIGFGQTLIWLNYRYYIAIMLVFVVFGLAGVIFYRTLVALVEYQLDEDEQGLVTQQVQQQLAKVLYWVDWPMVRLVSFCYMLVGHFSRAMPVWLELCFDYEEQPYRVLAQVAKQSEDFDVDEEDCTAEPCLLVKLAKRALLLILACVAILTITGAIN